MIRTHCPPVLKLLRPHHAQQHDTGFLISGSGGFQDLVRHYHLLPPAQAQAFQAAIMGFAGTPIDAPIVPPIPPLLGHPG